MMTTTISAVAVGVVIGQLWAIASGVARIAAALEKRERRESFR